MLQIADDADPRVALNFLCTQLPVALAAKMRMIGEGNMKGVHAYCWKRLPSVSR